MRINVVIKGLSFMLLGVGLTVSALAVISKREETKKEKGVSEEEIKDAIEKAKLRCDNGEITQEAFNELVEALERLLAEKNDILNLKMNFQEKIKHKRLKRFLHKKHNSSK